MTEHEIQRIRWLCWACRKKFFTYKSTAEKKINECPFCHAEKKELTDMDMEYYKYFPTWEDAKADMEEQLKNNLHMQTVENAIVIQNDRPSYEERQYMAKRKKELNIIDPPVQNSEPPLTTMPVGVKHKSSEYYLYNSYKNEGYGALVIVLCLLAILCGQWYMIFVILIAYIGMIRKNNNDLNNSPNIQKHRKGAKESREWAENQPEEFWEEERKRLDL